MKGRLKQLMERRLFIEAGTNAERPDQWSYPKGIMFGGMAELAVGDERTFAEQYFIGAEAIVDLVVRNDVADYTVQYPICYLYRHSIELYLKCIIHRQSGRFPKTHSLKELGDRIEGLPLWATSRIYEMHELDPRSILLRYGGEHRIFDGEYWCELGFLRDAMRCLRAYFISSLDGPDSVGLIQFEFETFDEQLDTRSCDGD